MQQQKPAYVPSKHQHSIKNTIIAGGSAGITEICISMCFVHLFFSNLSSRVIRHVVYPLDVAKTRAQLHSAKGNLGMFGILQNMIKTEGPLKMLRGIAPLVLMESMFLVLKQIVFFFNATSKAPKRAIKFSSNEAYKKLLAGDGKVNQLHSIMAGSMAGATEAVVVVPFELVKIRLQAKENVRVLVFCSIYILTALTARSL